MNTVKNYHTNNYDKLETHTKAFYISNTAILFLERFFDDPKYKRDYFAFCMYFINYNGTINPHQRRKSQSFLYLTPVHDDPNTAKKDSLSNYKVLKDFHRTIQASYDKRALNNTVPCYGTCDSSINAYLPWGENDTPIPYTRLRADINDPENSEVFMLTSGQSSHIVRKANYVNGQGSELSKKQTRRVYFKKEVICRLASFIRKDNNVRDFPMIGIYFGSYNDFIVGGQSHPNQTIVSFVPMRRMSNGYLEPDICSYIDYYNDRVAAGDECFIRYNANKTLNKKFSENHGTLCPTQCPTGGD